MKHAIVLVLAALTTVAAVSCGSSAPARTPAQKMIILGFDGLDPVLTQRWIKAGRLPNFAKLAEEGGLYPLETSHSPESPTAWASFATGANAGKHNIYDFLVRDTQTYMPDLGIVKKIPPEFIFNYFPVKRPQILSLRGGTSFWVTAGDAGIRSSVLTVPVTFPPETVNNGELLSGLPLPDIRGTIGTFYYFATDLSRYEEGNTEFGGILKRLSFDGNVARSELVGPPNPVVKAQQREIAARGAKMSDADKAALAELAAHEDIRIPFAVHWNRAGRRATVEIQDQSIGLEQNQWSKWITLEFKVNAFVRLHGMAQLFLIKADKDLRLYISPVNFRPDKPPVAISAPASFAGDVSDRLGFFRTLGWAEATWPLNEDRLDEQAFMDDLYRAFDDRAQVILHRLDAGRWDVLVGVIEATDRVSHMMWRFLDPQHPMYDEALAARYGDTVERVYRRADQFLAEVRDRVGPDMPIMIVSDHGFHSFRWAVNLNTWLVQEGYLALKGARSDTKTLDNLFLGTGEFWENVDWTKSKAYAMGLGQVFINVKGREGQGVVSPGAEYRALVDELAARLMTLKDPGTGASIVSGVYKRDDVYSGPYVKDAPDLQVGMVDGYRVSWQTTLGGSPAGLVYPNTRKWSGDHCGFDYKTIPGVLITNRRVTVGAPRIIDVAPTVLKFFGVPVPKDIDGRPLF